MAQKPSNVPLIIVCIVAGAALIGLNAMQQASDPAIREKMQKEAEREAAKKQAETAKDAPTPVVQGANEVAGWPAEQVLGKSDGKPSVIVAWEWTPALQGNPSSVYNTVEALKKVLPNAAIKVVNLDAKPGAAKSGISVDGKLRVPTAADGTFPQESQIIGPIMGAANVK